jgi:uncharacterized BrkB/YihY/UPF0761 family membrane protein
MRRGVLAAGFTIAAIPFSGFVATAVRYALRSHKHGSLPSWYGWIFAAASLLVTLLFLGCALRVLGHGPSWQTLWRVTVISLPAVALISLGSLQLLAGMAILVLAIWALRRREPPPREARTQTSRDSV